MENFKKEIEAVLARHPEIGDITITIKRSVTINTPIPPVYVPSVSTGDSLPSQWTTTTAIPPTIVNTKPPIIEPIAVLEQTISQARIAELKLASQTT